jgi:hypothetical protein
LEDKSSFTIKFAGELNQVDANTLISSLASLVSIIEEIKQTDFSDQKIDVKVKALSPGSFLVEIDLFTSTIETLTSLLTSDNVHIAASIVTIVGGLYGIRKFLKGKKPKEVDKIREEIEVTNADGEKNNFSPKVYNIYNSNININEALNNNFEALNSDPSVRTFEILGEKSQSIFKADKEEFSRLTSQEKIEEILKDERIVRVRAILNLFKIVFDDKYKWEFIYKGNRINAKISDDVFFGKIDSGEKFSKGDILEVELEILQNFDKSVNTFINKTYNVIKVFSHKIKDEQIDIDF